MRNSNNEFELEKQLHEQYAINNNANMVSIVTLITALLGVIGVYGYVFVNSSITFAPDLGNLVDKGKYSLDILLFATIASYFILIIIIYLAAYLGTNQRKEQFITYAIRRKHYEQSGADNDYNNIFPNSYHPFSKSKSEFIQGLYGEICCILKFLFWIITILTLMKLGSNINEYYNNGLIKGFGWASIILFSISIVISQRSIFCIIKQFFESYKKRENEFLDKKWGLKYKTQNKGKLKTTCCIRKLFC